MSNCETMIRVYQDAQAACGLKAGDWVKVLRKSETGEGGWPSIWDVMLNDTVGKVFQVCAISGYGIQVKYGPNSEWKPIFPYFVLEKVEKPAPVFKPFDRVLVRDSNDSVWRCAWFSHIDTDDFFVCTGDYWVQCIPYEGNEHLVGTTDSPEE